MTQQNEVVVRADAGFFSYGFIFYMLSKRIKFVMKVDKRLKNLEKLEFKSLYEGKISLAAFKKFGLKYAVVKHYEDNRYEVIGYFER